jgi:hypothetical protein
MVRAKVQQTLAKVEEKQKGNLSLKYGRSGMNEESTIE